MTGEWRIPTADATPDEYWFQLASVYKGLILDVQNPRKMAMYRIERARFRRNS